MDYNQIGEFIKLKRKEKNLTQKELASKLGITDKAISKWERGLGFPDVSLLEDLSKELNISILEIIKGKILEKNTQNDETENIIKSTLTITKEENKRKRKELINKVLTFIIIGTSLLLIGLNIIQIHNLNKEYTYEFFEGDRKYFDDKFDVMTNNLEIIKKNKGIYDELDYNNILINLEKIINELKEDSTLKSNTKTTYKTIDFYIMELKKDYIYVDNKEDNIIKTLLKYDKNELINSYYLLYVKTNENLTFNNMQYNYTIKNFINYKLFQDNTNYFNNENYISIKRNNISYKISNLLYLEKLIMEVGDIHE